MDEHHQNTGSQSYTNDQTASDQTAGKNQLQSDQKAATNSGNKSQTTSDQDYAQLKAELEATQNKLEEAQQKLQEMVQISQHALADLQNFKRRSEEEQQQYVKYANAQLVLDFLPAMNNLDLALKHEPKDQEWQKGIEQTLRQFFQILEKHQVKSIETVGKPFDPRLHEALMSAPGEKNIILEEFEKGYTMGEKVLKPARVKVGNGD